jgi:dienelactone hydrolase
MEEVVVMQGIAAGVPYVALPPGTERPDAPVVVGWHLMDPPRSEAALAAALPLAGLDAWRIYFGLPLTGLRAPAGGIEKFAYQDAVLNVFGPLGFGAAAEFPAAYSALRAELGLGGGRLAVLGGSHGAVVAQQVATTTAVDAIVLVSPVTRLRATVLANERRYGVRYEWTPPSEYVAATFDFVARADELTAPTLLVVGAEDDAEGVLRPVADLHAALPGSRLETVPGMAHALAEEPGLDPAPQTEHAAAVDRLAVDWLRTHLSPPWSTPTASW